jgi:hypothetical protein
MDPATFRAQKLKDLEHIISIQNERGFLIDFLEAAGIYDPLFLDNPENMERLNDLLVKANLTDEQVKKVMKAVKKMKENRKELESEATEKVDNKERIKELDESIKVISTSEAIVKDAIEGTEETEKNKEQAISDLVQPLQRVDKLGDLENILTLDDFSNTKEQVDVVLRTLRGLKFPISQINSLKRITERLPIPPMKSQKDTLRKISNRLTEIEASIAAVMEKNPQSFDGLKQLKEITLPLIQRFISDLLDVEERTEDMQLEIMRDLASSPLELSPPPPPSPEEMEMPPPPPPPPNEENQNSSSSSRNSSSSSTSSSSSIPVPPPPPPSAEKPKTLLPKKLLLKTLPILKPIQKVLNPDTGKWISKTGEVYQALIKTGEPVNADGSFKRKFRVKSKQDDLMDSLKLAVAQRGKSMGNETSKKAANNNNDDDDNNDEWGKGVAKSRSQGHRVLKIAADGHFGKLKFDMKKFKQMQLYVMKGRYVVMRGTVSPDLYDLLTKRIVGSRTYSDESMKQFQKLVELAEIPKDIALGKKAAIAQGRLKPKKCAQTTKYIYYNDPKELIERLHILTGEVDAGNHSEEIKEEARELLEKLKASKTINEVQYITLMQNLE